MKMKTKVLVAAITMAAAVQANAAINSDGAQNPLTGTGAGELFLSVVDRGGSNPQSYTLDLGITSADFRANSSSYLGTSFAADANMTSFLASAATDGGSLYWNLAGADNRGDLANFGLLTTAPGTFDISHDTGFTTLNGGMQRLGNEVLSINGSVNNVPDTNYAANDSKIFGSTANAFYDGANWGSKWLDLNNNTEAAIGSSMGFFFVGLDPADATGATNRLDTFSGLWSLATNGTLTYAAASAPVPLPPAVWLLGSALVGLVGVGRRRSSQTVQTAQFA